MKFRNGLRKVDVNTTIVDENIVHLEVGSFSFFSFFELDERVLQRVTRLGVTDDLTTEDRAEP